MYFHVEKASDYDYLKLVEINTFEELMEFIHKNGEIIIRENDIIREDEGFQKDIDEPIGLITIYDAYIE